MDKKRPYSIRKRLKHDRAAATVEVILYATAQLLESRKEQEVSTNNETRRTGIENQAPRPDGGSLRPGMNFKCLPFLLRVSYAWRTPAFHPSWSHCGITRLTQPCLGHASNRSHSMNPSHLGAALALAFSLSATPATAALTEGEKCAFKANLLSGKFSLCLNKADANVSKGKTADTAAADAKCETKFRSGWDKTRTKAQDKDADNGNAEMLGADCNGAMSDAVRDSVQASALIAAGRDLAAFAVSETDLADESGIQALVDQEVAAVDITSDNATVCTDAGGTWDAGASTCTPAPASSYNCFVGGFCAQAALEDLCTNDPNGSLGCDGSNAYEGDTQTTSPALEAGCNVEPGASQWQLATTLAPSYALLIVIGGDTLSTLCGSN